MEYIVAHDVGTSGCKAAVLTTDGSVVAKDYITYPTVYPQPLCAEQDPHDWWKAVGESTKRVIQISKAKPKEVLGLAFSTQMVNALPVDELGQPLRPCVSWLDGRAVEEAQWVMRKLGGPVVFAAIVGVALTGKDVLPKMIWIKRNEPDIYRRAAAIVDCSGYLLFRATGKLVNEWSTASVTGLFDLKRKTWDKNLIRFFGLDLSKFPDLVKSTDRVGGLTPQAASDLGLLEGTPVFGGAGDAMTAAVGSGAVLEGDVILCLGTSGFVSLLTRKRVVGKRGIATIQSADSEKLLLIGEMETAGECLKWAGRELYDLQPEAETFSRMDKEVAEELPGAGDLIFTPWMYGERCPVADERVRAAFINLGANHTRSQMTRAIYEGVAYNVRWILDLMTELYGFKPDPLRVMGGGAKGLPWLKIISDVTGRTLESVAHPQETTAIGAALIAAVGLGIYPSLEATKPLVPIEQVQASDSQSKPVYDRLYRGYRQVYRSLRKLYHELNTPKQGGLL
jgi:xylulokinase